MGAIEGKVAVVTGGGGSIGLATARLFVAQGARVMLADLSAPALEAAVAELGAEHAAASVTDVTDADSVRRMIDATVQRWGGIDILLCNAGNFGVVAPIDQYPESTFDAVYAVHVRGAFLTCKYGVPHLREGASIVITSSVAGTRGDPGVYAYITAKHAQVGLMRCLAKELAPRRIRVNTIHPGPLANGFQRAVEADLSRLIQRDGGAFFDEQTPLGRHGSAEEVARSVLYLASDMSSYTTGSMLMVDGGMSC